MLIDNWQKWLRMLARWLNTTYQSNPNPSIQVDVPPCTGFKLPLKKGENYPYFTLIKSNKKIPEVRNRPFYFKAMTSGLLSDTYLEAHTIVQITKTDDEIMGSDEITPAELRAIHEVWSH